MERVSVVARMNTGVEHPFKQESIYQKSKCDYSFCLKYTRLICCGVQTKKSKTLSRGQKQKNDTRFWSGGTSSNVKTFE